MNLVTIKKFINVMRNYPEIYAIGQSEYKNLFKKEIAWKKIKEIMGMDIKKLKIKWRSLRDTYMKHKYSLRLGSKGHSNLSNWMWASEMSFIEPYVKLKANESISNDFEGNNTDNEKQDEIQSKQRNNEIPETSANIIRRPVKRRRVYDAINISPELNADKSPENIVKVPCDRTDMEFLGYANTMKQLSLRSQALIKLKITKILTQFQLEELSRTIGTCNEDGSYMTTVQLTDLEPYFIDVEQKHSTNTQT